MLKNYFIPKLLPILVRISLSRMNLVFQPHREFSITFNCSFVTALPVKNC